MSSLVEIRQAPIIKSEIIVDLCQLVKTKNI